MCKNSQKCYMLFLLVCSSLRHPNNQQRRWKSSSSYFIAQCGNHNRPSWFSWCWSRARLLRRSIRPHEQRFAKVTSMVAFVANFSPFACSCPAVELDVSYPLTFDDGWVSAFWTPLVAQLLRFMATKFFFLFYINRIFQFPHLLQQILNLKTSI